MINDFKKFRYRVVMKFGDLYYQEMTPQEALEYGFRHISDPALVCKSPRELEMFVEDNINIKMPLDGPQWRSFNFHYEDAKDGKKYMV